MWRGGGARGWPDEMKLAQFPFVGPILRMSSRTFIRIRNEREETRRVIRRRGRACPVVVEYSCLAVETRRNGVVAYESGVTASRVCI